jgi:AraC-like DNA-binding protein
MDSERFESINSSSSGLKLIAELVALHDGRIKFATKKNKNSCVRVIISFDEMGCNSLDKLSVNVKEMLLQKIDLKKSFIEKIKAIAQINYQNSEFNIDDFAKEVGMSRAVFYKKMKEIVGNTPNNYLINIRLSNAKSMLRTKNITVAEVCYFNGFGNPTHFSRCFKEKYNICPSEFQKKYVKG